MAWHLRLSVSDVTAEITVGGRVPIVCRGCGGAGRVAGVALAHAAIAAGHFDVTLFSDSFPARRAEAVTWLKLQPLRFNWLR